MIGTTLGHYRIENLLGTGGMGEVYLAHDTRLGRQVALKVLSGELARDPDRRLRFEREARAAAALNHPNIITIHSVEEIDGTPFLTLELVDGQTLAESIPAGGLPLDRVLALGIPIADAVGAAHQSGITHRDLKPANVMVTNDGRVKVLDFGLAKVKEEARLAAEAGMPTAAGLTSEGRIVGTVSYMSPEQAEGKPVDQRSDVFSLGILLYEMATGERPFGGDTHMSTLSAIIKDTPRPILEVRPGLPRELAKIINRCLAKDVEDRYQSAKDLRNDLRALKNDLTSGEIEPISASGVRAAVVPAPAQRSRMVAFAAVAVLAAVGTGAWLWWRAAENPSTPAVRPFDSIKLTRLTTAGTAGLAAMSLDGRYVAHVSIKDGRQSLWLRQIATTSNVEVVPPDDVRYVGVTFSPDGNHIYYARYKAQENLGNLYQVPVLGGGARLILEDVDTSVTFSADAKQFAFIRGYPDPGESAIVIANADGTNERKLAVRARPLRYPLLGVAWSPDGKSIAATGGNDDDLRGQVVIVDVASAKETVLPTPDWRQVSRVAWLPDGSGLLVNAQESAGESSNQIFFVAYPSGASRRLTNDLTSYSGLSIAPDGKSFVAIRNERRAAIWTMALDQPAKAQAITAEAASDEGAQGIAWTPDGRIVYTTEASGNPDIWIMNADGSRRVQLTSNKGLDISPRVTSDGRYVVFASDRDGAVRAWRMALDGSGPFRPTSDVLARPRVNLSADGKWIYYNETSGESRRVSIDGGQYEPVLTADVIARLAEPLPVGFHEPAPSPDGAFIAGHYNTARGERIVVLPARGGAIKRLETVPPSAQWTADGRGFIYMDVRGGTGNLIRQLVAGGEPAPITLFTSEQMFNYALSPDQKRVAAVRGQVRSDVVLISMAEDK
jgi:eukaryotic-like serine/threonine-protein kinase